MTDHRIRAVGLRGFEVYLRENEKSGATLEKYMRDIRRFAVFVRGGAVDKAAVMEYKAELAKTYALTSANSMLAALNAFFRYAGWFDCCVKQFKIQREAFCAEEKELTRAEYAALVRAAEAKNNERLSLLIQTVCGTGIRVSELCYITAEAVKRGEATVSCKGKTRRIFIVAALRKKLLRYAREQGITGGMIFVTKSGRPMNRTNIWAEMKRLCGSAGVSPKKVFPHNLRHLFARTFYGMEKDIVKLADILGHSNVNTTRIYTVTSGSEHRRKLEKMKLIL